MEGGGGPDDYMVLEKLGEGSFGKVYKAVENGTGRTVAVKVVPIEQDTGEVAREIEMLKTCNSSNIVRYYSSFTRGSELWIVMEFCAGSSLGDIMEARSRCLTEVQISAVLAGTLAGLAYLHDLNKIHRDIKAGNLLLTDKGQVKLADFGVSAQLNTSISRRGTVIGTPFWMAPEVISSAGPEAGYNSKADIWSLGITAIELAEGQPPNASLHPMRAIFLIPTKPPPHLTEPDKWSSEFNDFVRKCLAKDASERPSASELLSHPFITTVASAASGSAGSAESAREAALQALMDSAAEALVVWRKKTAEQLGQASSAELQHATPLGEGRPIKRGDTQEFDLSAIRDAARRMGDDSELGDLRGAGGGTMFIKDGASAPVAIGSEDVSYGTMIVKDRQQPAPLDAPSDTGIPGGGGGTVIFRPAAGDGGGGGTMVFNNSAASAPVPGFMRQFQSSNNVGGGGASSRGGAVGSNNGFGAAAGGVDKEDLGSEASNKARHKYDFTHLNVKEIDEELAALDANLERDMAKLRRQYEKRERALRQAREGKSK